jgi:signal transduction histidine kinase
MNTCNITNNISTLAYYSHLIPIFFSLFTSFLVFFKSKSNVLSKIFLAFSLVFSVWLLGDLITWVSTNYYLIYASWSILVYVEILFFTLGLYFILTFIQGKDVSFFVKLFLFTITLVPFALTVSLKSVTGFDYPVCEAFNNNFLDQYKLYTEIFILVAMISSIVISFIKKNILHNKKTNIIVIGSMFLFLAVFGIAEYIAATTGFYELHLYSLFIIPLFLIAITYSIFRLDVFNLKIVSTYFLVFGFLILTGAQLLFITNTTNRILTLVTLGLSIVFSFMLFKNLKSESDQRVYIEKLNVKLETLLQQRESLTHLVTHKVKGAFTRTKYIFAEMLEGTFGVLSSEMKDIAKKGLDSDNIGIQTVDLVLNAANLQTGTVKYDMKQLDFKKLVQEVFEEMKVPAGEKKLEYKINISDGEFNVNGDNFWLKEVVHNLIDNAIKYTQNGSVSVDLQKKDKKVLLFVKDSGVGITEEDKKNLFKEGGRGKDSVKINVDSTGYGLFTVKLIVEAHKGKIWAESAGQNKGSTFFVELNAI